MLEETWETALHRVCIRVAPRTAEAYRKAFYRVIREAGCGDLGVCVQRAQSLGGIYSTVWRGFTHELMLLDAPVLSPGQWTDTADFGQRRESFTFHPGTLGTSIALLDKSGHWRYWEPFGLKQRPIQKGRLVRYRKNPGLSVLVADSFSRPLVFFESPRGDRRLADGHHRLTLANEKGWPTTWMTEIRTEGTFPLRGDWNTQFRSLNMDTRGASGHRYTQIRGFRDWERELERQGGTTETFSTAAVKNRVAWKRIFEAVVLADRHASNASKQAISLSDLEKVVGETPISTLRPTLRALRKWSDRIVDNNNETLRRSMPKLVSPPVLAVWIILYRRYTQDHPGHLNAFLDRVVRNAGCLDESLLARTRGVNRLDQAFRYLALAGNRHASSRQLSWG